MEHLTSHPTMGAWIEILNLIRKKLWKQGRTPRWVRGLKSISILWDLLKQKSHPTMGAWIEIALSSASSCERIDVAPHDGCVDWNIFNSFVVYISNMSHPTMGAWIEIPVRTLQRLYISRRTPRWVRGLKCYSYKYQWSNYVSHPTMGAWIEIYLCMIFKTMLSRSHPTMGAWIEISNVLLAADIEEASHPTMGAWIEIIAPQSTFSKT